MLLNSVSLILAKVFSSGLGFLAWLVAARLFASADVGLASAVVAAMMLCVQFAMVGVGSSVITLYPRFQDAPARLLDVALSIVCLAAVVLAVAFLLLAGTLFRELSVVASDPLLAASFVVLCALGAVGVLLDQISTALRRGYQALGRNMLAGLVTLATIAVVPLLVLGRPSVGIVLAWLLGALAACALAWFQLRRSLAYRYHPVLDRLFARRLVDVGLPNYVLTLAERAPGPLLPLLVTELLSPQANAYWYAAWMMAWVIYIIPIQTGLSQFAEAAHRPEALRGIVGHGVATSLVLGLASAAALTLLAEPFLGLLGSAYAAEGSPALRILVWAVVPIAFIQAYFSLCRATGCLGEAIAVGILSATCAVVVAAVAGLAAGLAGMAVGWVAVQSITAAWALARLRSLAGTATERLDAPGHVVPLTDTGFVLGIRRAD